MTTEIDLEGSSEDDQQAYVYRPSVNHIYAISIAVLFVITAIIATSGSASIDDFVALAGLENQVVSVAPEVHLQLQPRPSNVNIVIIGDSISRYGYLSLVYFLRWGRWFDPSLEKSNLVHEHSFDNPFHYNTYSEFFFQSSLMLQPFELCDCHTNENSQGLRRYNFENRYYHDPVHNNTVTFILAYGTEIPVKGRLNAQDAFTSEWKWSTKENSLLDLHFGKPTWSFDTWDVAVTEYIAKLNPKPQFLVVNAGQFGHKFGPHEEGQPASKALADAVRQAKFEKTFWKTTTFMKGGDTFKVTGAEQIEETDAYMCDLLGGCLSTAWTKSVKEGLYWDDRHFYEPIYRVINEDMLEQMGYLSEEYIKFDRYKLLEDESMREDPKEEGENENDDR
jgi:hypothetical protein